MNVCEQEKKREEANVMIEGQKSWKRHRTKEEREGRNQN
jgi:hypothetical protein